jgi:tetratricopeptide (TPR) repeat protein
MHNLAVAYRAAGRLDEALPLHEQTLELKKAKLGPDHPDTLISMNGLAETYRAAGQLDRAVRLHKETLERRRVKLGPDNPDTLISMNNLALAYGAAGRLDEALPLLKQTLELTKARLGPDHPDTLSSMGNLASAYQATRELDRALPLFQEVLERRRATLGPDHPHTLSSLNNLAVAYRAAGRLDEALPLYEAAARGMEQRRFRHEDARTVVVNTIRAYEAAGQDERAGEWRRKWLGSVREHAGAESPAYDGELAVWGLDLLQRRKWAEAEPLLREWLAIRERVRPDAWNTFNSRSMLGEALLGQEKYADAEPLLLAGYEGLKAREKTIPPEAAGRIPEALDRLVALYTATGKPDEVRRWRAERAKYPFVAPMPRPAK